MCAALITLWAIVGVAEVNEFTGLVWLILGVGVILRMSGVAC